MGGSNTIPVEGSISSAYGTFRVPSSANFPGARMASTTWADTSGNLWLFGGEDIVKENDLWKYLVP